MTAIRQCGFCNGNHTEVKCPSLDGYIRHLNAVVSTKSPTNKAWCDEDYMVHYNQGQIWSSFWRNASFQEKLGFDPWVWNTIILTYGKKLRYREAGLKRRGIKRKKIVNCGYCNAKGHTRRTCDSMNKDIAVSDSVAKLQRTMFLDTCKSIGMGVGTLIKFEWTHKAQIAAAYYPDLPETIMGVITSIPVSDINPFICLVPWDNLFHNASFGINLINPTGRFTTPAAKLDVGNGIFSGAFDGLSMQHGGAASLNRYYSVSIVAPSSNFDYRTGTENNYKKNTFKKYGITTLERHVNRMQSWLKEQS